MQVGIVKLDAQVNLFQCHKFTPFWNADLSGESRNAVTERALVEYPVEAFGYAPIYAFVCSKADPGFVIRRGITECPTWCIFGQ